jgi:hypothetical protein
MYAQRKIKVESHRILKYFGKRTATSLNNITPIGSFSPECDRAALILVLLKSFRNCNQYILYLQNATY